jgi:hypothetical protein
LTRAKRASRARKSPKIALGAVSLRFKTISRAKR